jgi:hypothetical protein
MVTQFVLPIKSDPDAKSLTINKRRQELYTGAAATAKGCA